MKDIKEYLHFYIGCHVVFKEKFYQLAGVKMPFKTNNTLFVTLDLRPDGKSFREILSTTDIDLVKPILRPLSDMTDEYFLSLFKMSIGCFEDMNVSEFKRWSSSDLYVRLGYGQFIFGYAKHPKPDVRVEEGISFFIKEYLIEDRLELTDKGLTKTQSHFNKENLAIAFNQSVIFNKLRKDSFDVDGLIESNLAIDSTKHPTNER